MIFSRTLLKKLSGIIFKSEQKYVHHRHPLTRTWETLTYGLRVNGKQETSIYPKHTDIVIIGGGFLGSSAAYWLKTRAGEGLSVVVIEKDPTYAKNEKMLSHAVLSQHFSLPENIFLSKFSAEFLRNAKEILHKDIDIQYCPLGYLLLASDKYVEKLEENVNIQKDYGIKNQLLTVEEIQRRYPWINTSGVKLGCIGTEEEGIFNAKELHRGFICTSQDLGANYIKAEMIGFKMERQRDVLMEGVTPGSFKKINNLLYRTDDGEVHNLKFAVCVITAGAESANVARLAKIGESDGLLTVPLPIEKRECNTYSIENTKDNMSVKLNAPYVMDTSGLWLRRNGLQNNLVCGQIPSMKQDPDYSNAEVFQASLSNRYPQFTDAEVKLISTDILDCNTFDDTGIVGSHVYHNNLLFATGFGRHGIQHSPGIGRAISEAIVDNQYSSIDLTRFAFDRLLIDEPMIEINIY